MRDDLIKRACSLAMKAHDPSSPTFLLDKPNNSSHAIFAFPGSWCVDDWFTSRSFGDSRIDLSIFPSLRSVGNDETAIVNGSFLRKFELSRTPHLQDEVRRAVMENKQIVFTGHSSGGPVAILTTIWLLEEYRKLDNHNRIAPFCVTFGSPLVGDQIFGHALRRENWSRHFINFVMQYDIVPRILLAPLSSIEQELPAILHFFDPNSTYLSRETIGKSREASVFVSTVMRNALSVTSHAACLFMACTNLLLEAVTSFIELSPYRPFGTYIFCTGNGKLVTVKNPDAILQLFFYCLQLSPEQEVTEVAYRSLKEHLVYEPELHRSLQIQDVVYLDNPEELPLSSEGAESDEMRSINMALNDLGLSTRARMCLCAAGELEKQKLRNQAKIDTNFHKIEELLQKLHSYRSICEVREVGYYDTFKYQKEAEDFNANVNRLDVTGMWDEIVEMLKRYELPDGFEGQKEWVDLATKYRRLVEPVDIANYYRHFKNDDTGPYTIKGRPKRYKYTQRWLEHASRMAAGSCSESCFWAEVEELCIEASDGKAFEEVKERVLELEKEVLGWARCGVLRRDVFLEESTFVKWWKTLPRQHKAESCIAGLMNGEGRNLPTLN